MCYLFFFSDALITILTADAHIGRLIINLLLLKRPNSPLPHTCFKSIAVTLQSIKNIYNHKYKNNIQLKMNCCLCYFIYLFRC